MTQRFVVYREESARDYEPVFFSGFGQRNYYFTNFLWGLESL